MPAFYANSQKLSEQRKSELSEPGISAKHLKKLRYLRSQRQISNKRSQALTKLNSGVTVQETCNSPTSNYSSLLKLQKTDID